ncbi:MAG: RNase adapter RapZ [Pyrinomonadaceae bacterium]|nr:RNase adapter RapZ [Pyrinomonadaceae bacterium]
MNKKSNHKGSAPKFVIITGLSGSGMSSATNAFEDLGYFCVDNLPLTMLRTFSRLLLPNSEDVVAIEKAALVINIRERHFLSDFPTELSKMRKRLSPFVLFFEASDEVLQRRFSETRRPHPADSGKGLARAIRDERSELAKIRKNADLIVDTSEHTVHTLRRFLIEEFGHFDEGAPLHIQLMSFGHKHGSPSRVDLLFDVRHLPNPYFERGLRELPGTSKEVIEFLEKQDEVIETTDRFIDLLRYLIPLYKKEGKSYLIIGIGCTGGRHRSVMVTNKIAEALKDVNHQISVVHRDVEK